MRLLLCIFLFSSCYATDFVIKDITKNMIPQDKIQNCSINSPQLKINNINNNGTITGAVWSEENNQCAWHGIIYDGLFHISDLGKCNIYSLGFKQLDDDDILHLMCSINNELHGFYYDKINNTDEYILNSDSSIISNNKRYVGYGDKLYDLQTGTVKTIEYRDNDVYAISIKIKFIGDNGYTLSQVTLNTDSHYSNIQALYCTNDSCKIYHNPYTDHSKTPDYASNMSSDGIYIQTSLFGIKKNGQDYYFPEYGVKKITNQGIIIEINDNRESIDEDRYIVFDNKKFSLHQLLILVNIPFKNIVNINISNNGQYLLVYPAYNIDKNEFGKIVFFQNGIKSYLTNNLKPL